MSLEIYSEKTQNEVNSIYAKTELQNSKIIWFWTMGGTKLLHMYIRVFGGKKVVLFILV